MESGVELFQVQHRGRIFPPGAPMTLEGTAATATQNETPPRTRIKQKKGHKTKIISLSKGIQLEPIRELEESKAEEADLEGGSCI